MEAPNITSTRELLVQLVDHISTITSTSGSLSFRQIAVVRNDKSPPEIRRCLIQNKPAAMASAWAIRLPCLQGVSSDIILIHLRATRELTERSANLKLVLPFRFARWSRPLCEALSSTRFGNQDIHSLTPISSGLYDVHEEIGHQRRFSF